MQQSDVKFASSEHPFWPSNMLSMSNLIDSEQYTTSPAFVQQNFVAAVGKRNVITAQRNMVQTKMLPCDFS
jgi:hypothetical protein